MRRQISSLVILALVLGLAAHVLLANEPPVALPEFRVEGTPWLYAKLGDLEILTRASPARAREMAAAFLRGQRLLPSYFTSTTLPMKLVLVDSSQRSVSGMSPLVQVDADEHRWAEGYEESRGEYCEITDKGELVMAANLAERARLWMILMDWVKPQVYRQRPAFPDWVTVGLFGAAGPLQGAIGIRHTTSVRLPRLSWPDPTVEPGTFPATARDLPEFAVMFDPARKEHTLPEAERWKFQFQTACFARWSLFGPAKNGRNRNGYWAFAEMARRGQTTEAIFRECYGMDWTQARAEMRAYLKPKNLGMIDVQMPQVMADVPEVERLEFREATIEEVRRILGDFNRLRAEHGAQELNSTQR